MEDDTCVICLEPLTGGRRWWRRLIRPVPVHRWCLPLLRASMGDEIGEDGVRRQKAAELGQITMSTWPTV